MRLSRFQLSNLRNLSAVSIDLSPQFNFFVGPNGAGKSSLVEGLALLATGRSFRTSDIREAIRHGQSSSHLFVELVADDVPPVHYGLARLRNGRFEARVNGENVRRLADALRLLPAQFISPESLALLSGGRRARLRFLDYGLFHVEPRFYDAWRQYERLLSQRNEVLKARGNPRLLDAFDHQLPAVAEVLTEQRQQYVERLDNRVTALAAEVAPDVKLHIRFEPGWNQDVLFGEMLAQRRERDFSAGFTTAGVHRAGFDVQFNGRPADEVCSRGQLKLVVTCLKLAQGEDIASYLGSPVLYVLDDVESELDSERREKLVQWLRQGGRQAVISAIHESAARHLMLPGDRLFHVEQGTVTRFENID